MSWDWWYLWYWWGESESEVGVALSRSILSDCRLRVWLGAAIRQPLPSLWLLPSKTMGGYRGKCVFPLIATESGNGFDWIGWERPCMGNRMPGKSTEWKSRSTSEKTTLKSKLKETEISYAQKSKHVHIRVGKKQERRDEKFMLFFRNGWREKLEPTRGTQFLRNPRHSRDSGDISGQKNRRRLELRRASDVDWGWEDERSQVFDEWD